MTVHRVFVEEGKKALIVCNQCGKSANVCEASISRYGTPIKAKCPCGYAFDVQFEIRKNYRKTINLLGFCTALGSKTPIGSITVTDISTSGVGLTLDAGLHLGRKIKEGDILEIEFSLDDNNRSKIKTRIVVRNIQGNQLGGQFSGLDQHTAKLIGFYLMP
ncbi:MAG: PilZ domain-containing protein [Syntrophobacteraceae bacterium]